MEHENLMKEIIKGDVPQLVAVWWRLARPGHLWVCGCKT